MKIVEGVNGKLARFFPKIEQVRQMKYYLFEERIRNSSVSNNEDEKVKYERVFFLPKMEQIDTGLGKNFQFAFPPLSRTMMRIIKSSDTCLRCRNVARLSKFIAVQEARCPRCCCGCNTVITLYKC